MLPATRVPTLRNHRTPTSASASTHTTFFIFSLRSCDCGSGDGTRRAAAAARSLALDELGPTVDSGMPRLPLELPPSIVTPLAGLPRTAKGLAPTLERPAWPAAVAAALLPLPGLPPTPPAALPVAPAAAAAGWPASPGLPAIASTAMVLMVTTCTHCSRGSQTCNEVLQVCLQTPVGRGCTHLASSARPPAAHNQQHRQ